MKKEEKRGEKGRKKKKGKRKENTRAPAMRNWESPCFENEPGPLNKHQGCQKIRAPVLPENMSSKILHLPYLGGSGSGFIGFNRFKPLTMD